MLFFILPTTNPNKTNACGAGIISNEWALTAAHCFLNPDLDANNMRVIAGTSNLRNRTITAKRYNVTKYIQHEKFIGLSSKKSTENDIAVIKISPPLEFNKAIRPLKLPEKGKPLKIDYVTIAGWGKTDVQGNGSLILRQVRLPRMGTLKCIILYGLRGVQIHKDELCYGFHNKTVTKDKCQGDSGGPLVNKDGIVVAIVSKGAACGTLGLPGIDTNVLYHRDWIKKKTGV
ncbi:trypsin-like [Leptopilina heterotoma]|uniref:trypsin-like n=1 Tax=Leptopilina heterotoma TaxID=63436 RepID=UPI001CA8B05E|nr:trypsin-like [Leptopilina heterotoma]